ncbi:MAG: alpha/beta fold hydrolase [Candidatus Omnitrophica bacterium]|nr:alpha/beta fold hydrolase [Candidatus Omnitrophota bacterium]
MRLNKKILVTQDKRKIAYKHLSNDNDKLVVIVHGFFNSKDSELLSYLAEHFHKSYDVVSFDLRGHGESDGLFSWTTHESKDLEAVLNEFNSKYKKIAVIGFSLGGSISINVLSKKEDNVETFICVSAPSDFDKVDFRWWKLDVENDIGYSLLSRKGRKGKGVRPGPWWRKKEKPIDNIGKIEMPILFIHGDKDWVVDKRHSEELYKKTNSEKEIIIISNGPHAEYLLRKNRSEFCELIDKWLVDKF